MRQILHPGPAGVERTTAVAGPAVPLRFVLEPGLTVDAAIHAGFAAAGCAGGFVEFRGGRFEPFRFVIPAVSPDDRHVAWYSGTFAPEGSAEIERACAIVGVRDGKPFIHCHGIWNTSDGRQMGHLLAPDTVAAAPVEVTGIGMADATFEGVPDPETNFTLFEPVRVRASAAGSTTPGASCGKVDPVIRSTAFRGPSGRAERCALQENEHRIDPKSGVHFWDRCSSAWLAKVRPNRDITLAIEEICARRGIAAAEVFGIGSLNGVRFADGRRVDSYATELLIRKGRVTTEDGSPRAQLDIDVVDIDGAIFSGELVRGDNPVCITFELVIAPLEHRTQEGSPILG